MTESQARVLWCPMVRCAGGVNNKGDGSTGTHCVGSRCMMWRWHNRPNPNGNEQLTPTDGYCGLAGKP